MKIPNYRPKTDHQMQHEVGITNAAQRLVRLGYGVGSYRREVGDPRPRVVFEYATKNEYPMIALDCHMAMALADELAELANLRAKLK